jgi:hypothetical protein
VVLLHHAALCRLHRARIMFFNAAVEDLEARIAAKAVRTGGSWSC